ncbi:MAG: bifunctional tetrahydrofolate synthase/dihydrofolate synthase [Proteobacteria bacterium]|nr:bifunctional tetrahydrofolate synthase/dihydrofolate synthase [Pseudomonadota bacterium]
MTPAQPTTLDGWLAYIERQHAKPIALGLERVAAVWARMGLAFACPLVTVAGTNGKGSTCALLEAMLRAAGYRTGLYTSPHITRYNERVRIDGVDADDDVLVAGFAAVEAARGDTPLTYFEYGTLAALWAFAQSPPDALILEVGLGGRLDAVNILDADVAVLTSVGIDHVDYLGPTRESIGFEKAGIFRPGRPAVIGEPDIPATVLAHANAIGAVTYRVGHEFRYVDEGTQWRYEGPGGARFGLPVPALRGAFQLGNAAVALTVLDLMRPRLVVTAGAIRTGLVSVDWPMRMQVLPGRPTIVLDAAHNPHAAMALASALGTMGYHPQTFAVFAALADKDVDGIARAMAPRIDRWFVGALAGPRADPVRAQAARLRAAGIDGNVIATAPDVAAALAGARALATEADRIVIFGSFLTLAAARAALGAPAGPTVSTPTR